MLCLCGGMFFTVRHFLKKTDPSNIDPSLNAQADVAQDFLPFNDIKDSMIDLGGHNYRAIIECSSINYNLKTADEKTMIEMSFQRFVNSLSNPIVFYIQTKTMNNSKSLALLKDDLEKTVQEYPFLSQYANVYYEEMTNIPDRIGTNKIKKKYIIVPYNEANKLTNLNDADKYRESMKELKTICTIIMEGLSNIGIKTKILNTREIVELLSSTYHKDNYSHTDSVVNGDYLSMFVEKDVSNDTGITADGKLDWILYETQMKLQTELINSSVPEDVKKASENVVEELSKIRNSFAGYYSSGKTNSYKSLSDF